MTTERTPLLPRALHESNRLVALDLLRGILMILMALDHSKLFLSTFYAPYAGEGWWQLPEIKPDETLLFLSRWIATFCAPGFCLLMGWGIGLFVQSRRSINMPWKQIIKHYVVRGAILIFLDSALIFRSLSTYKFGTMCLFALGCNMILASLFLCCEMEGLKKVSQVWSLSERQRILVLGSLYMTVVTFLTILPSWTIPSPNAYEEPVSWWFRVFYLAGSSPNLTSYYPPIPWLAHVLWGVAIARISSQLKWNNEVLGKLSLVTASIMFSVAIPLRYWPNWTSMNPENVVPPIRSSLLSFFYNVKYPPSVVFTLVTLSGNHLVLSLFFKYSNKLHPVIKHVLLVYGTNSLFFYCTHMLLFRAMRAICGFSSFSEGGFNISQWWSVAVCYLIALVIEYWICLWFGSFKKGTRKDSLWRLF